MLGVVWYRAADLWLTAVACDVGVFVLQLQVCEASDSSIAALNASIVTDGLVARAHHTPTVSTYGVVHNFLATCRRQFHSPDCIRFHVCRRRKDSGVLRGSGSGGFLSPFRRSTHRCPFVSTDVAHHRVRGLSFLCDSVRDYTDSHKRGRQGGYRPHQEHSMNSSSVIMMLSAARAPESLPIALLVD